MLALHQSNAMGTRSGDFAGSRSENLNFLNIGKHGDIEAMMTLLNCYIRQALSKRKKGQGVIEYAGALVIAAVLVAAVIGMGPDAISALFTQILTKVQTFFTSKLP